MVIYYLSSMSPRRRTKDDAAILEAAGRIIARLGPANFTLADVAREVGLSAATLVQRFGSKRGLMLAVAESARDSVDTCFAAVRRAHPSPLDALVAAATDELMRLHRHGPTEAQFLGAREALVRDYDGRMQDNAFWTAELTSHALYGWPLAGIAAHRQEAEAMTLDDVRRACAAYIPASPYLVLTTRPESAAAR